MEFFGVGGPELLAILVIALLVLGPQRLVRFAKKGGRMVRSFREMTGELTRALSEEAEEGPSRPRRGDKDQG